MRHLTMLCAMIMITCCTSANNKKTMQTDTFTTKSGKKVVITPIKHACLEINFDGVEFQIDPVISGAQPITDYKKMPKADYILVTHEHGDHLDPQAINDLRKPSTVIIANKASAEQIEGCEIMANGDTKTLAEGIELQAVAAYNNSEGHTQFHPKGRDNGYILTLDGLRIYIAGDTEDIPEMQEIKDIDVALLPCNLPYTMTPQQLRHATEMIKPKVMFPYHYGETDINEILKATNIPGVDVRIRSYK